MIKKYLLLFLAFLGIGLSFSNAGYIQQIGIDSRPSYINNDYDLSFLKGGGLLTQFVFQGKSLLAFDNYAYFWWSSNGQPYFYDSKYARTSDDTLQGFFNEYYLCDYFTGNTNEVPLGCVSYPMTGDYKDLFKAFFSRVNQGDYAFYDYEPMSFGSTNYDNTIQVCWSSAEVNKSLCFRQHSCYNGYGCSAYNYGSLINSQGISGLRGFLSIPNSWLGYAPGNCLYDGGSCNSEGIGSDVTGSVENNNQNSVITGSYVYDSSCTYKEIVDYFTIEGSWSKYFCYGGLDNFDLYNSSVNYSPVPGSGKTLNQILTYSSAWDTPIERYNFWNGLYKDNTNNYNAMWESYPAVYHTWFDLYYQYGGGRQNFNDVLEFCNIVLNYDTLSGSIYKGHNQNFINSCKNLKNPVNVGSGIVAVGVNRDGIGGRSGNKIYSDGSLFIQDIFNKLKYNFNTNYGNAIGILPTYIILALLAVLLFKFLRN